MFVEGTLRWRVTEDCPWDLLIALCLRDLAKLKDGGDPRLPPVWPPAVSVRHPAGAPIQRSTTLVPVLCDQWLTWWRQAAARDFRINGSELEPPHFPAFDRLIELQDLIIERYDEAAEWATARHSEYAADEARNQPSYAADIVETVRRREHELRRQAGYFRLDIAVLPLAERGAWIVGPDSVVISRSLWHDHDAFRAWLAPIVAALV